MANAIVIEKTGGVECLKLQKITPQKPKKDEVLVKQTAIGVNFIDIYHRTGLYQSEYPATLGFEACGVVEEVGESLKDSIKVGQRVAYATAPMGAYATHRVVDPKYLVNVPDDVTDLQAASYLLKGLTAHMLLRRAYFVTPGNVVVVHAAAGSTGSLIVQWAKQLGALVIGTVGSDEKIPLAQKNGCDYVFNYMTEDFAKAVLVITNNKGANVVYDSVGKETFSYSLDCLMSLGVMVNFGQSSGVIPPLNVAQLAKKSLYLTRPSVMHYKANRQELVLSAAEVFALVSKNKLNLPINKYKFQDVAKAHQALEGKKIGANVLIID